MKKLDLSSLIVAILFIAGTLTGFGCLGSIDSGNETLALWKLLITSSLLIVTALVILEVKISKTNQCD
jgi:hypothetical protein